jgi:hypothetical protein
MTEEKSEAYTLYLIKEDMEILKENSQIILEKVEYICNAKLTKSKKLQILYDEVRKRGRLYRSHIDDLLNITGQHSHNLMKQMQSIYPESVRVQKHGNANVLVYMSEADRKVRKTITNQLMEKKELYLGQIMQMCGLEYTRARTLMKEIARAVDEIEYNEDEWLYDAGSKKKIAAEGIKLKLKETVVDG